MLQKLFSNIVFSNCAKHLDIYLLIIKDACIPQIKSSSPGGNNGEVISAVHNNRLIS